MRQIIVIFDFGQDDEAAKVISVLVSVAVVLADALVELGALAGAAGVAKLVETERCLKM